MRLMLLAPLGIAMMAATPAMADHDRGHGEHGHGWHGDRDRHDRDDDDWRGRGWRGADHHPRGNAYGYYRKREERRYAYRRGYRFDPGYNGWVGYSSLPWEYRHRYGYNPHYRYVYRDDVVYVVDPTTRLVRDIVDLLSY